MQIMDIHYEEMSVCDNIHGDINHPVINARVSREPFTKDDIDHI